MSQYDIGKIVLKVPAIAENKKVQIKSFLIMKSEVF